MKLYRFFAAAVLCGLMLISIQPQMQAENVPLTYSIEESGRVSLAIYDARGRRIRELLRAEEQEAGEHTILWDGLDRNGNPVAGDFEWRLATNQGLKSEYLLSIGTSFGHNIWPAQHGGLCSVETDGSRIFVTAGMSEGAPQSAGITMEGEWRWVSGPTGGWMGGIDLALDGDTLYYLGGPHSSDARLFIQQAESGRGKPNLQNTQNWGGYPNWHVEKYEQPRRVDARDGELIIASLSGLIVWLDPQNGEEIDRLTIEGGLTDVALLGGGRVLAISGSDVVEVARGAVRRTARMTGLKSPQRVTVDRTSGQVFIVEGGKSQQIKRFNSAYQLQGVFGREGGRKTGLYNPEDFLAVSDISGDGTGGFVVTEAESAPRRTARFDADGKLLNEWYGGQQFFHYVAPEPDNPDMVWTDSHWGWFVQAEVDYEKRTWRPRATYRIAEALDTRILNAQKHNVCHHVKRLDLNGDGKLETYIWIEGQALILKVDEEAGLLRPVAALGTIPERYVITRDAFLRADLPDARGAHSWTLYASVRWHIGHAGQHAWLEVVDDDDNVIVSLYMFRGERKPNVTSNAGHTNYIVFNNAELMNATNNPNWNLTSSSQPVEITVADGIATVKFGNKVESERPVLQGEWARPERLRLRTTRGGAVTAERAAFAYDRDARRHEVEINLEGVEWVKPPVEPEVWAEAIRMLGQDAEDANVRQRHRYFTWADANGDYAIQPEELRLSSSAIQGSVLDVSEDFDVYFRSDAANGPDYRIISPRGRTATGSPIWDWRDARPGPNTPFSQTRSLWSDRDGNVYQTSAYGGDGYNHHWQWPATYVNATAVVKTAPDGTMLWQAGERAGRMPHPRGQMHHPINTLGAVHGCIGFADYIANPAEFWTEDGLYIGGVFDNHAEGLHPRVYSWWRHDRSIGDDYNNNIALLQYDLLMGGNLVERPNGDVLFFGCGWNNMPVYRVTGWDEIRRQQGIIAAPPAPRAAAREGTGLRAEYFANNSLEGKPGLTRIDGRIWFDQNQRWPDELTPRPQEERPDQARATEIDDLLGDIVADIEERGKRPTLADPFSARWTGTIEPVVSGRHTFSVYTVNSGVRLSIGGRLILDRWQDGGKFWSQPIELKAGHRYPIQIEMRRTADNPELHLNWEALDLPIEHIPQTAFYPDTIQTKLHVRPESTFVTEGSGLPARFILERTGPVDAAIEVPFRLEGSARPGIDYRPAPVSSVIIQPGQRGLRLNIAPIEGPGLEPGATVRLVVDPSQDYVIDEQVTSEIALRIPEGTGYRRYDQVVGARNSTDVLSLEIDNAMTEWEVSGRVSFNVARGNDHAYLEVVDAEGKVIASIFMYRGDAKAGITRPMGHTNYVVFNDAEVELSDTQWRAVRQHRDFSIMYKDATLRLTHDSGLDVTRPVPAANAQHPAFVRVRSTSGSAAVRATGITIRYAVQ